MFYMKHAAAALLALSFAPALAQEPKPVTPDFSEGFCAGWATAVQSERQRYANWKNLVVGDAKPTTVFGTALGSIAESIPLMVLLPEITGKFGFTDGRTVDCTPKPPTPPAEK